MKMVSKDELAVKIYQKAHLEGEFVLRSGQVSNEYFDKFLFESEPQLLVQIAEVMKGLIPPDTEVIAGLELGGIPVVTALSIASNIQAAFVRKQAKEYGTCKLAEGADVKNRRVCIVEDIVTTGGQIIKSMKDLRDRGAIIDTVLCVIQRNESATEILAREGLALRCAFTMEYIKAKCK